MQTTYYVLVIQPDEPIEFVLSTKEEYQALLDYARTWDCVIDEEASGCRNFQTLSGATKFLNDVYSAI